MSTICFFSVFFCSYPITKTDRVLSILDRYLKFKFQGFFRRFPVFQYMKTNKNRLQCLTLTHLTLPLSLLWISLLFIFYLLSFALPWYDIWHDIRYHSECMWKKYLVFARWRCPLYLSNPEFYLIFRIIFLNKF